MRHADRPHSLHDLRTTRGFTIVELLIVIVVIGILAAIVIVTYNGIQQNARVASIQSDLTQAAQQLSVYKTGTSTTDQYPPDQATANLKISSNNTYSYSYMPSANYYCLTVSNGSTSYYVSSLSSASNSGSCPTTNGLVGWWPLNNDANDASGNNDNGSISNAITTQGQDGRSNSAYSFNGTSSRIVLSNNSTNNAAKPALPLSVSLWVKLASISGAQTLFSNDQLQCSGTNIYSGAKVMVTSGVINFLIGNGGACGGPSRASVNTSSAVISTANQWYNIIVTADASLNMNVYVNGSQVSAPKDGTGTATSMAYTTTPSRFGADSADGTWLNGSLDDIRIYNRVLTGAEISTIATSTAQ